MKLIIVMLMIVAATPAVARADDQLGFAVQSRVYVDQSRDLLMVNNSTIDVSVSVTPTGGWGVDRTTLRLMPGEHAIILVTGNGDDGARIELVATSADRPDGGLPTAIALAASVYHEAPFDLGRFVGGLIPYLAIAAGAGWLLWRLKPWQIRLTRTTR